MDDEDFSKYLPLPAMPSPETPDDFSKYLPPKQSKPSPKTALSGAVELAEGPARGIARGVAGIPGALGSMSDLLLEQIPSYALSKTAQWAGALPKGKTAEQFVKEANELDLPRPKFTPGLPTSQETIAGAEKISPWLERKGQLGETTFEMIPGAMIGPGGMAGKAIKYGALPGAAQETVERVAPKAPFFAAPAAGLGVAMLAGLHGRPTVANQLVTNALKGATQSDLAAAESLVARARAMGVNLTRAEALQQVTGGFRRLGNLQRVAEGQDQLDSFYANRPSEIKGAVESFADTIEPQTDAPSLIGKKAGTAAADVVADAHAARTERSSPYYKAAAQQHVAQNEVADIVRQIDEAIANDQSGLLRKDLTNVRESLVAVPSTPAKPAERAPVTDPKTGAIVRYNHVPAVPARRERYATEIESLDRARKYFRDIADLPFMSEKAIDKETAARVGRLMRQLDSVMERRSLQFRLGKNAYEQASRDVVEPIEAGPIGKLAKVAGADTELTRKARNALFPSSPEAGSEREIFHAVSELAAKDPTTARQLVGAHIRNVFQEAARELQSGESQYSGATFRAALIGNEQQAKNLDAAIRALPGGDEIKAGFDTLMEVVGATGKRQRIGSQTAFNQDIQQRLKNGLISKEAATILLGAGIKWPTALWGRLQEWNLGHNVEEVARLLTDPTAGPEFRKLAGAATSPQRAAQAIARLGYLSTRQPDRTKRASGGRIGKPGYPAKKMSRFEKEARRAHLDISEELRPMMDMPDADIVNALRLTKG